MDPQREPDKSADLNRPLLGDKLAQRFFGGLVEYVFQQQLGIANPAVSEYLVDLCLRSISTERFGWPDCLLGAAAKPPLTLPVSDITQLKQVLDQGLAMSDDEFVDLLVCTGDAALVTVGFFSKSLSRLDPDQVVEIHDLGKGTYLKAATLRANDPDNDLSTLYFFSDNFEKTAFGLHEVSKQLAL